MSLASAVAVRQRFDVLDGMRGVAALAVVTAHFPWYFGDLVFGDSVLAVDLFFCLSGFVIAGAYARKLDSGDPRYGLRWFVGVRLVRLYPLYVLGTTLGILAYCLTPDPDVPVTAMGVVFSLMMLPVPGGLHDWLYPYDGPAWSLFLELAVNFVWAVNTRATRLVVVLTLGGSLLAMLVAAFLTRDGTFAVGYTWNQVPFGLARAFFSFTIGVLLYRRWRAKAGLPVKSSAAALTICVLVAALLSPSLSGYRRSIYDFLVVVLAFPTLVYVAARINPGPMMGRVCGLLGATSYGVYVLHGPLGNLVKATNFDAARYAPWSAAGLVCGVLAVTWLLDWVYDIPVRRKLSAATS